MSTFAAPYLPLAGAAASGHARPATSSCCVIGGPKRADQAARAHQSLCERR